jgi:heme exporter protein A
MLRPERAAGKAPARPKSVRGGQGAAQVGQGAPGSQSAGAPSAARLYSRPMPAALSFVQVRRRFGRLAVLGGVSGAVGAGEALLVTGRNGAGKSTLLRCLAGLLAPDSGTIDFREDAAAPPLDAAARRRSVGLVAPDLAFYGELTAAENLAFFARLRGLGPERGDELLRRLELPPDRPAAAMSSGMRQRLRWAWALLHRPSLLLLDEPFQNLDAAGVEITRRLLAEHLAPGLANPAAPSEPAGIAGPTPGTCLAPGAAPATGPGIGSAGIAPGPAPATAPATTPGIAPTGIAAPGLAVVANPVPLEIGHVAASLDLDA